MASFNRVILVGNITRDIEIKYLSSGTAVTEIGLAVNDRRKSQSGEWIEETTFVDVTLWGRTAEVAGEYLSKGSPILVEGRLKLDTWETNDGQKRSKLRVVGERMQMLGSRGDGGGSGGGGGSRGGGRSARYDESEYSRPSETHSGPSSYGGASQNPNGPSGGNNNQANQTPEDDIPF